MSSDIIATQLTQKPTIVDKVFFYVCDQGFPHLSICLAEGLKELGIEVYANLNFWQISPEPEDYLFRHEPSVTPEDCAVVVVHKDWIFFNGPLPENLFQPNRTHSTVYLDDIDGINPSLYPHFAEKFDFIFKTHCNRETQLPHNYKPWAFGLSNRILQETQIVPDFEQRRKVLSANFRLLQDRLRVTNQLLAVDQGVLVVEQGLIIPDYPIRRMVRADVFPFIQNILPIDETVENVEHPPVGSYHYLQWQQTGSCHYPNYYERLKATVACASFGGWMVRGTTPERTIVEWWDSWRFWESLAAGCVTFHVDFEKYEILLPVMPQNWEHYIGIDLDDIQATISRLAAQPELLKQISTKGRQWAIENYGPVPTALRFLEIINASDGAALVGVTVLKNNQSLPIELRDINLMILPDWSVPEEFLYGDLERLIRAIMSHPDQHHITLLIDSTNISDTDAELVLAGVMMNLLMEETFNIDDTEKLAISLVGKLSAEQWNVLWTWVNAVVVLPKSQRKIVPAVTKNIPALDVEQFTKQRAIQLETGRWYLE